MTVAEAVNKSSICRKHCKRASIFSRVSPSIRANSSSDKPEKSGGGRGGGGNMPIMNGGGMGVMNRGGGLGSVAADGPGCGATMFNNFNNFSGVLGKTYLEEQVAVAKMGMVAVGGVVAALEGLEASSKYSAGK